MPLKLASSFTYKYTTWVRAFTTTTAAAANPPTNTIFYTQKVSSLGWWCCGIGPRATPAHISSSLHFSKSVFYTKQHNHHHYLQQEGKLRIGFCGSKSSSFSTERKGSAPMGPNKEDKWFKSNFSPTTESLSSPAPSLPDNFNNHDKPPPQSSKLLTLPTILTIGRVAAVPVLIGTFYIDSWWGPPATTCIFIAAAITDWLDGYLARKMKLGSVFGAFLDPVADKLMVAATLVLLCTRPLEAGVLAQAPWLLPVPAIAIIGREITMSAVREWAASQGSKLSEAVAVNNLGKWKTATQMTALTVLLASRDSSIIGTGAMATSGVVLLYISAWLAVWSLVVYMRKIWKVLLM